MSEIELVIVPGRAAGLFRVEVVRSPAGEASAEIELDVGALLARRAEIENAVLASGVASRGVVSLAEQPLREVGQALFTALLGSGDVTGRYRASEALAAGQEQGLRVVLRIGTPALAGLPWEAMYDAVAGGYVCRHEPLVRHVPVASPVPPLAVRPPLRVLGIVSSPRGLEPLDAGREKEQLTRALARPCAEGLIGIHWAAEATWAELQDLLLGGQWHVLHFIGHGDFDISRDEGALFLTREDGRPDLVEADRLVDLLREARPMPRLVVLNSCSGAATGVNDLFAGTAAALVRGGVSAVAAMQWPISDAAACAFARGFYTAIAHGRGVDDATRSGRVAIVGTHARTLEWVTPVMYLRGRDSRLFDLDPPLRHGPVPEVRPATVVAHRDEHVPRSQASSAAWSWERYAAELSIPAERIEVGRRLAAATSTALRERGLDWQMIMRQGHVAFKRAGGYNVLVIDLYWNRAPRLAAKIPADPAALGLTSPFPDLPELWIPAEHEWGWTVAPGTPLPDPGVLIDLIQPFQPASGPMPVPPPPGITRQPDTGSTSGRGTSRYIITTADSCSEPLRKRDVVLAMINALRTAGVSIQAVAGAIPPSRFLRVEGTLTGEDLKQALTDAYPKATERLNHWFADSPVHDAGKTWVLTKDWGRSTEPILQRLTRLAPPRSGIRYDAAR